MHQRDWEKTGVTVHMTRHKIKDDGDSITEFRQVKKIDLCHYLIAYDENLAVENGYYKGAHTETAYGRCGYVFCIVEKIICLIVCLTIRHTQRKLTSKVWLTNRRDVSRLVLIR